MQNSTPPRGFAGIIANPPHAILANISSSHTSHCKNSPLLVAHLLSCSGPTVGMNVWKHQRNSHSLGQVIHVFRCWPQLQRHFRSTGWFPGTMRASLAVFLHSLDDGIRVLCPALQLKGKVSYSLPLLPCPKPLPGAFFKLTWRPYCTQMHPAGIHGR
jgi:hypothetical protein